MLDRTRYNIKYPTAHCNHFSSLHTTEHLDNSTLLTKSASESIEITPTTTTPATMCAAPDVPDTPPGQMPTSQDISEVTDEGFDFLRLPIELRVIVYGYLMEPEWHTIIEWKEELEEDKAKEMRRLMKKGTKFSKQKMYELWALESKAKDSKAKATKVEKPKPQPRLALRIPNSIPPVHLTCRFLLEETREFFKPLVVPSRIPRIMFRDRDSAYDYPYDLEDLLYNINDCLRQRDRGKLASLPKEAMCSSRKLHYSDAVQLFVERTLKALPEGEFMNHYVERQVIPLQIVLQSRILKSQWPHFEHNFGFECAHDKSLAVHMYSMGQSQEQLQKDHRAWFDYKGQLTQEAWDAEWA